MLNPAKARRGSDPSEERHDGRTVAHRVWRAIAVVSRSGARHARLVARGNRDDVDAPWPRCNDCNSSAAQIEYQPDSDVACRAPGVVPQRVLLDHGHLIIELVLFTVVMVPVERWIGTYRWLGVFAAGHVGATLATTIGIWLEVRSGAGGRALLYPVDIGASYGLAAVAAVLAKRLPRPLGPFVAVGLGGLLIFEVVYNGTFTDWGHLAAFAIGLALAPLVRPRDAAVRPSTATDSSLLARAWRWLSTPPRAPAAHRVSGMREIGWLLVGAGIASDLHPRNHRRFRCQRDAGGCFRPRAGAGRHRGLRLELSQDDRQLPAQRRLGARDARCADGSCAPQRREHQRHRESRDRSAPPSQQCPSGERDWLARGFRSDLRDPGNVRARACIPTKTQHVNDMIAVLAAVGRFT